jgi:hypothetical protein
MMMARKKRRGSEAGARYLRRHIKQVLLLTVAAVGIIGGFFLPNAVAEVADSRNLDSLISLEAQSITIEASPKLSLPERVALTSNPNTEMLVLKKGQVMEAEEAEIKVIQELSRFFRTGSFEFINDGCTVEDVAAVFIIDSDDPSANMITWEFRLLDVHANEAIVILGDETGLILKMIYRKGNDSPYSGEPEKSGNPQEAGDDLEDAASLLSEMMTLYYGLPVMLGDYQRSGDFAYYRTDMTGDGIVVPMYGVIRETGFTMNERP